MNLLLPIIFIVLFSFIIWKWKWFHDPVIPKYLFVFLFIIKAFAGVFAGGLYLKNYAGGDAYALFQGSWVITESIYSSPQDFLLMATGIGDDKEFIEKYGDIIGWYNEDIVYNDSKTIIRFNAFFGLISFGQYFVHIIFFSFLSMIGLTGIFKAIRMLSPANPYLLVAAIFLIPGVIFWLSLASKESILTFAMGLLIYFCIRLLTGHLSVLNTLGMFLSGFLFIHIKAYLLVLITPALIGFTWTYATGNRYAVVKYAVVYLAVLLLFFNVKNITGSFDPVQIIFMKRMNFEAFADAFPKDMRSYIDIPSFTGDWQSMLIAAPGAMATVFIRPFLWESESLLITFAAIENVIILLCLAIGIIYINPKSVIKNQNLLLFCFFFAISVFVLIGLTTPVMGAMVRYKAPVLPFVCLIPVLLSGGDRSPFREKGG